MTDNDRKLLKMFLSPERYEYVITALSKAKKKDIKNKLKAKLLELQVALLKIRHRLSQNNNYRSS